MKPRKPAAILKPPEQDLHRTVAEFLDWALYPQTVYTTFPAGWGKLSKKIAGILRACGLKAGFPDILVFDKHQMIANRTYTKVVGLELKTKTKASAAQQLMFPRLRALGIEIYICHSLEDVIAALDDQCITLRGRIGWDQFKEDRHGETSDEDAEARRAAELT